MGFRSQYFLTGHANGDVRLYRRSSATPLITWDITAYSGSRTTKADQYYNIFGFGGRSIADIKWSIHRPGTFFVLDSGLCLHCFDILEHDHAPVVSEQLYCEGRSSGSGSPHMSLSHDRAGSGSPAIAVSLDGQVIIRRLNRRFYTCPHAGIDAEKETELVQTFLDAVIG